MSDFPGQIVTFPASFTIDFAWRKPAGNVASDNHVTVGYCNRRNFGLVARCPDGNHMTTKMSPIEWS